MRRALTNPLTSHLTGGVGTVEPELIAPIVALESELAVLDEEHLRKQPDWSFDAVDSGSRRPSFEQLGPDLVTEPSSGVSGPVGCAAPISSS